jgi:uncharacterized protein YgbK (DUF1537 family)
VEFVIGVVADDITGANDIGIMFAKANIVTDVYAYDDFSPQTLVETGDAAPEVVILDTNSRLDAPEIAYNKVFQATNRLREAGARIFINKTCSVFRGNIGAEFDAMLDALKAEFAVVVLGFPKNGRTTVDGIHYVHGKRLEDSEFRNDPVQPMTKSHLVDILQSQTGRKADLLDYRTIDLGSDALTEQIELKKRSCNYLILDVKDQEALSTIARAVRYELVLCGSSGLAEELAHELNVRRQTERKLGLPQRQGVGVLCAAGSLMPQTAAQINYMKEQGVQTFELDTRQLIDSPTRQREAIGQLVDTISRHLLNGHNAVLHSSNDPKSVEDTKRRGAEIGLSSTELSRLVSGSIAEIVSQIVDRTGQNRLLIAGGETSAAVCSRLGITGLRIWEEIEPGLPSCVSLNNPQMLLVLKSGSFGRKEFFASALHHLLR